MKRSTRTWTFSNWTICTATLILCTTGLLCLLAAAGQPRVPSGAAAKQLAYILFSVAGCAWIVRVGYEQLGRWAYALYWVSLALLIPLALARMLGALPFIRPVNATYRWIHLPGFNLQPAEIMKITLVIALAWSLRHKKDWQRIRNLVRPFMIAAFTVFFIVLQPDLGTVLLMMSTVMVLLLLAGIRVIHVAVVALTGCLCVPVFWAAMEPYQRSRVTGLLLQSDDLRNHIIANPENWKWLCSSRTAQNWESGPGYQLIHSKGALGHGGFWGQGWGQGVYVQYAFLPFKHNDFIFSMIGEQWGLAGCMVVLCCYLVLVGTGLRIAARTPDPFGRLLCGGMATLIGVQFLVNVGTALGLIPAKGMTLPFVSYGGSSIVSCFLAIGIFMSVARRRPFTLAPRSFEDAHPTFAPIG